MSANPGVLIVALVPGLQASMHALTLLRNRNPVRIIEKNDAFLLGTKGCGMQPRTTEIYKLLGLLPDLLEVKVDAFPVFEFNSPQGSTDDKDGKRLPMIDILENTPDRPFNNTFMVMQERQELILRSAILRDYGVQVELSTELLSFEEHEDHVVAHIVKRSGGEEKQETVSVHFLVGADGGRSTVRRQLGIQFVGDSSDQQTVGMVVGDIVGLEGTLDQKIWRMWGSPRDRMLSLRPCCIPGKNQFNIFVGGINSDLEKVVSSRDEVIAAIRDISGRDDMKFGEVVTMSIWRPNIRMANSFGKGRVFIAGDAGHVHSPTGGQGMNSGAQDAINLAWKLALVEKNLGPKSILESYTAERVPVIAAMLEKTTELFKKTFKPASHEVMAEGWKRGYELRMFGVNYRNHTHEEDTVDPYRSGDDGTIRAGDRAPEAPQLAQLFTFLIFAHPGEETEAIIHRAHHKLPKEQFISSSRGYCCQSTRRAFAYKHYKIEDDKLPTFVSGLVHGAEGLREYFNRVFL
ncbi:hypothetical protein BT96DRAFT_929091 [Gymnopus androsaceus JB14]|uniref:FAD-binding domain-containing protein n=1 Tax=Gymnopus androsaceus JB14 TaxID=1447944 RepID=A0A6A4GHJ2_9AGAR|nr:hypothetical protein BT96DRAFT_929091 [Gymnopus androsaceus JB14]